MSRPLSDRTWSFPKKMTEELTGFTALIWLGFVVAVSAITLGLDRWSDVNRSTWDSASQLARWFTLFIGVHVGSNLLPLNIAHGKTRRDFSIEAMLFLVVYALAGAILMTLGWVIERGLYAIGDWPQHLDNPHLFSNPHDYPRIFIESFFIIFAWTTGGAFIASAYYRYEGIGLLTIAPSILVVGIMQSVLGFDGVPFGERVADYFDPSGWPLLISSAVAVVCVAALMAMSWPIVRDIPMRRRSA